MAGVPERLVRPLHALEVAGALLLVERHRAEGQVAEWRQRQRHAAHAHERGAVRREGQEAGAWV